MSPSLPPVPPLSALVAPTEDPLRRLWGPVTIRVVWELVRKGLKPRPPTLRAAREHVLWRLPPEVDLAEAEARVAFGVDEYARRLDGDYRPASVDPDVGILPDPRWRGTVLAAVEPLQEAVFRLHYGDGEAFDALVQRLGLRPVQARAAREAVRELVREVVAEGGVSTEGWEPARVDRLVARVANAAGDACPGPGGLATEVGRAHADECPRCGRALRLIREGLLSPSDLFSPDGAPCLPAPDLDLGLVQLHPDGRRWRRGLVEALGEEAIRLEEDLWMLPGAQLEALGPLVEERQPPVAYLRGARRTVAGRWGRAVTGPGVDELLAELRGAPWGEVRGVKLPEARPEPPSAARLWAAAALGLVLTGAVAVAVVRAPPPPPDLAARAELGPEGLRFWVEPTANVAVIGTAPLGLRFQGSSAADKASLARPDGGYALAGTDPGWLLVVSAAPLPELGALVAAARDEADLRARLAARHPEAVVLRAP